MKLPALIQCLLLLPAICGAQTDLSRLKGSLTRNGNPSAGVQVLVKTGQQIISGTISDNAGNYTVLVPPGTYDVRFAFSFETPLLIPSVVLPLYKTVILDQEYPPCFIRDPKDRVICPEGHKDQIIPVVYGNVDPKNLRLDRKGKAIIGDCWHDECSPQYYCKVHQIKF